MNENKITFCTTYENFDLMKLMIENIARSLGCGFEKEYESPEYLCGIKLNFKHCRYTLDNKDEISVYFTDEEKFKVFKGTKVNLYMIYA